MRISKKTKEQHEKRILKTASSLFLKQGYARVGVDLIMKKAGLTSGALYSRFSGKEEILWSLFNEGSERVQNAISKKRWLTPFDPYYKEDWQLLIRLIWDMGLTHPRTQRSHARLWKDYLEWIEIGLEKKKIATTRQEIKALAKITFLLEIGWCVISDTELNNSHKERLELRRLLINLLKTIYERRSSIHGKKSNN